jgi:hypothetical protein
MTIAGAAPQNSSKPDRTARDWHGEFQADCGADFPFRGKYPSRPAFADVEGPPAHRSALIRGGDVEFRINFVARITPSWLVGVVHRGRCYYFSLRTTCSAFRRIVLKTEQGCLEGLPESERVFSEPGRK